MNDEMKVQEGYQHLQVHQATVAPQRATVNCIDPGPHLQQPNQGNR